MHLRVFPLDAGTTWPPPAGAGTSQARPVAGIPRVTGGVPTTSHRRRAFLGSRGGYRKVHFMRFTNSYAAAVAAAVAAVVFSAAFQPVEAAVIAWNSPVTISGTSDVDTVGTLFASANFGSGTAAVVNGVTFSPFTFANNATPVTVGNITLAGSQLATWSEGSPVAPYANLPVEYRNLLGSWYFTNLTGPATITFSGLTPGDPYSVQYWINDSRGGAGSNRTITIGTQTLACNTTQSAGGLGQWIKGTFTANAATQSFTVGAGTDNVSFGSAVQIRVVPEPSTTVTLIGSAALVVGWRLRRGPRRLGPANDA